VVVNGRFLRARPTGLHRVGRALLDALLEAGLDAEVVAPPEVEDPRVDRHVRSLPGLSGRGRDHAFEQFVLPVVAGRRPVLSLTNTGPVLARRGWLAVHDLAMIHRPDWYAKSMQVYARTVVTAARRAERVITFTEVVKSELVEVGVRAERVIVVRESVDPSFRPATSAQVHGVLLELGLTDLPYVLMLGWAHPRKDLATALAAHRQVHALSPHRLVLVGDGHGTFAGVERPTDDSVLHVGHVNDEQLVALLTGARALLYPSLYEGFGLPPLEAWACGTPALVADVPALRESTQGRGELIAAGDVDAWADALLRALAGELTTPILPEWSWADAAQQLRAALPAEVWK
jgi:glycosyltransferase involved in cell wall biosynthesis